MSTQFDIPISDSSSMNGHANGHDFVPLNMQGVPTPPPKALPVDVDALNGCANPIGHGTALEKIGLRDLNVSLLHTPFRIENNILNNT